MKISWIPSDVPVQLKKAPHGEGAATSVGDHVRERVGGMLSALEREGDWAVRRFSRELDDWDPASFELTEAEIEAAESSVSPELEQHLSFARERTGAFAQAQRDHLADFEVEAMPGVHLGQRHVPVERVGAYLPAGRAPLLASPLMTVLVPKVAGVDSVVACTPPQPGGGAHPAMVHAARRAGADRIFVLGGVQALGAMAFGLVGIDAVDMVVGAGNAFVAEAKRQLYGQVGIDLLAGPSEIAVIADDAADPELVAADLLGQAEHGPTSPAALITTSASLADAVGAAIERQIPTLATSEVLTTSWREHGIIVVVEDREDAAKVADALGPEHLEVQTGEDDWYADRLRNYGSLFIGAAATVAYSDKGTTGTNHVLPTERAARYTSGLSVAKFLKPLTYQRIDSAAAARPIAEAVAEISATEGLPAHEATARMRLDRPES